MPVSKLPLSRRSFLAATGAVVGSNFLPAFAATTDIKPGITPPSFSLFYKPATTGDIWDTWLYYHQGTFYLYYNPRPEEGKLWKGVKLWNGIAMATSKDGVHWQEHGFIIDPVPNVYYMGAGAVWPAGDKFIMNFSQVRMFDDVDIYKAETIEDLKEYKMEQSIFFAESADLMHWTRLGSEYEFKPDPRWYNQYGRWDNIWAVARPEGGYYGYFAGWPKGKEVCVGFGESDDGFNWRALPPALLPDVSYGPIYQRSPEVTSAYLHQGKYYLMVALDDLSLFGGLGITTMVSDTAGGSFHPASKNRRLLVCNASHFLRLVDVGDEVLANHHSWEIDTSKKFNQDPSRVWMAPLKKVEWDDEGTMRLKWWDGNEKAKAKSIPVKSTLIETAFDPDKMLILEGEMSSLASSPTGLYLQGPSGQGTGFIVYKNGLVEYGDIKGDGSGFVKKGSVNREISIGDKMHFRLIRKGQMTEFYLNDYLMQCYSTLEQGTGRIGLMGSADDFGQLKAWYCA